MRTVPIICDTIAQLVVMPLLPIAPLLLTIRLAGRAGEGFLSIWF